MENVFTTNQYQVKRSFTDIGESPAFTIYPSEGGIEPITKISKSHTMHLLVLTFIIIGIGIVVVLMLQSFGLVEEKKFDEAWCKSLLSKHDPNVLDMGFDVNNSGASAVKTNYTFRFSEDSFVIEVVSIVLEKETGRVLECDLEAISNKGIDLLSPKAYSCRNDTSYRLSSKEADDYLYTGSGVALSLSSQMMKNMFAMLNITSELTGFTYIDNIRYRRPDDATNHQIDLFDASEFISSWQCTEV